MDLRMIVIWLLREETVELRTYAPRREVLLAQNPPAGGFWGV